MGLEMESARGRDAQVDEYRFVRKKFASHEHFFLGKRRARHSYLRRYGLVAFLCECSPGCVTTLALMHSAFQVRRIVFLLACY